MSKRENQAQLRRRWLPAEALENRAFLSVAPVSAEPVINTSLPAPVVTAPGASTSPGPVLTAYSPTFQWNAVTGVTGMTGYQLNLFDGTRGKFTGFQISPTATSFTLSDPLPAGDIFVWNLRVEVGSTFGPPSTYEFFRTAGLPVPVVTAPGSSTSPGPVLTTLSPTFQWNAVTPFAGFTGYQLNLYDGTAAKFRSFSVSSTATSFTLPDGALPAGHMFVWNLRVMAGSQSGSPSIYEYFQTPQPAALPAPVITGPGSSSSPGPVLTTLTPTLTWNAVPATAGMTGYQLNLYDGTAAKFMSFHVDPTATSLTLPAGAVTFGHVFVWNLRITLGTHTGPESNYLFFQGPPVPVIPTPVATGPGGGTSPGPVLTTVTPTLMWNAVPTTAGMTGYQVNIYDGTAGKFNSYHVDSSATSFTVPAGVLPYGHMVVWNVRVTVGGQSGPPSNYEFFQTPHAPALPAPVITGPGDGTAPGPVLTTLTPTLMWNAVPATAGMTGYQINFYDGTKSVFTSYRVSPTATSFTLPAGAVTAGDKYVWNLRIVIGSTTGPESNYLYFQGPAAAPLPSMVLIGPGDPTAPGPVLTTLTPTFTWNAVTPVAGMTGLKLNLFDATDSSHSTSYMLDSTAASFTLPAGVLVAGDTYAWNVRAMAGTVQGGVDTYLSFQAPPAVVLPVPNVIFPGGDSPGPVLTTLTPTLQWFAVASTPGMTGYQINLYDGSTSTFTTYHVASNVTSFTLPAGALEDGDLYVWNVRVTAGAASGAESASLYFQGPAAV